MTFITFDTPVSGAASVRARQLLGCAAAALALGAFAPAASAATECGVPIAGAVTCLPLIGGYPAGISYIAGPAINVTIPAGVLVSTTTAATNGVTIASTDVATLGGAVAVVTTGVSSDGVFVVSTNGPVSVSTGAISVSGALSNGIVAGSSNGSASVVAGKTTVTGLGGNAIRAQATGAVSVISSGASAISAPTIIAQSINSTAAVSLTSGTVNSVSSDGIDITGSVATLQTASGTSVYGGLNGVKLVSTVGSNVTNAGTIGGGLYAIANSGAQATIINTGTINGALSLSGGNALVTNAGTFNALGTSTFSPSDRITNTGVIAIGAASPVPVSAMLSGLFLLGNAGTITMANGHAGDSLTDTGNYSGSGNAQLVVDLIPGAVVASDKMIISGSAQGFTAVNLVVPAGSLPLFNSGTVIVQAGAGSSATAFGIAAGSVNAGLVRYDVSYNPVTTGYSLVAVPGDAAYNMLGFGSAERNLWNKSADAVTAQMQSRRDQLWSQGGTPTAGKFWMTMAGSVDHIRGTRDYGALGQPHVTDTGYNQDYIGGQIGLGIAGGVSTRGGYALGITGGYINSRVKLGGTADKITFDAVNGGLYGSFTSGNLFINALGKYDYYWANAQSSAAGYQQGLHGSAYGARGEIGLRFGDDAMFVEPVAQLSWIHTSLDPFNVLGTNVSFDGRDGLHGKAGARIGGVTSLDADTKMSFYAGASYVHDFKDESRVTFANAGGSYTVTRFRMPDYGEAVAGLTIASGSTVSGFMEGTYTRTFKSGSGVSTKMQGVGGRAGINVKF